MHCHAQHVTPTISAMLFLVASCMHLLFGMFMRTTLRFAFSFACTSTSLPTSYISLVHSTALKPCKETHTQHTQGLNISRSYELSPHFAAASNLSRSGLSWKRKPKLADSLRGILSSLDLWSKRKTGVVVAILVSTVGVAQFNLCSLSLHISSKMKIVRKFLLI